LQVDTDVSGTSGANNAHGVKIEFVGDDGRLSTLYYFSVNIDNGSFRASGFAAFCERLGTGDAFVKSASYLMHRDHFSDVCLSILGCCCRTTLGYLSLVLTKRAGSCIRSDTTPVRSVYLPVGTNRNWRSCLIKATFSRSTSVLAIDGARRVR